MTAEEMDRAIAEHLGWSNLRVIEPHPNFKSQPVTIAGTPPPASLDRSVIVPRYSTDLNAMHEAEKTLTDRDPYLRELQTVTQTWDHVDADGDEVDWFWELATATATQRAEAFLRTIGKWRDA